MKIEAVSKLGTFSSHYDHWLEINNNKFKNCVILCIPRLGSPVCGGEITEFAKLDIKNKFVLSADTPEFGEVYYLETGVGADHLFATSVTIENFPAWLRGAIKREINDKTGHFLRTALIINNKIVERYNTHHTVAREMGVILERFKGGTNNNQKGR